MPQVSIIVVNYNGRDFVIKCLKAIERQSFKDFEVVIVDNNSFDGSLYEIRRFLEETCLGPCIKLVPHDKNLGFAAGNHSGLRHAAGRYIALINNDAEPDEEWLGELVRAMDIDPKVGICASKIIVYGNDVIDSAGDGFSTSLKGFKRGEGEAASLFNREEYVFGACAGAALYRRKMIEEIGFFDEEFFLIHEDTDLNYRAQLHGWKTPYMPTAIAYHRVRSSIGHMSDMAVYYTLRNSELVRIKNVPLGVFIRCFPDFLIGALTEFLYFAIKHRRLKLYFKAKKDAIKMLPGMLKKRAVLMKSKKVGNKYLLNIMTPVWQKNFLQTKIKKFLRA
jgi:GT2 family glycosyltransferase